MRIGISSGHLSVDMQAQDAISYIKNIYPDKYTDFTVEFPEFDSLEWGGSWVDTESSGVDMEYMSWVIDWIEHNTSIMWEDGEPFDYKGGE